MKYTKTKANEEVKKDTCPNCGYCPHCGQAKKMAPTYVPIPYRPWGTAPYWDWTYRPGIWWSSNSGSISSSSGPLSTLTNHDSGNFTLTSSRI